MSKIILTTIIAGLMLVAVGIAMSPIQDASAVHTTVQASVARHFALTGIVGPDADAGVLEEARWAIPQPFEVISVTALHTADTGDNCDLGVSNIRTDMIPEAAFTEIDPAASNAVNDSRILTANTAANVETLYGNVVLAVGTVEGANCDADARVTVTAIIETTGALTAAPTATISAVSAAGANGLAND